MTPALLLEQGRDVELFLVGSGEREAALRAQAERLGLGDRLRMLGGLPEHKVADIAGR